MKHLIAFALAVLMALSCTGLVMAEAQTYDLFTIGDKAVLTLTLDDADVCITLEEGATEFSVSHAMVMKEGLASCMVSIAKSDMVEGQSLTDLGEEGLEALKALAAEQFENPEILTGVVNGITYVAVKSYDDAGNIHSIFTIVNGYFVQTTQYHDDFSPLTEEDGHFAYAVIAGLGSRTLE
ncbi:MAG: hypothetical protein ACI4MJ_05010 [Aristaeellaceae bacterium]